MAKSKYVVRGQRIDPTKLELAKAMRRQMTPAEKKLWDRLRRNELGYHFRRHQIIDGFIADFYCHAAALILEVDGPIHQHQVDYDANRTEVLNRRGLIVFRLTNEEIMEGLEETLERVRALCQTRVDPSQPQAEEQDSPY